MKYISDSKNYNSQNEFGTNVAIIGMNTKIKNQ